MDPVIFSLDDPLYFALKNLFENKTFPLTTKERANMYLELAKILNTMDIETMILASLSFLEKTCLYYDYEKDYFYWDSFFPFLSFLFTKYKNKNDAVLEQLLKTENVFVQALRQKPGKYKKSHPNYRQLKDALRQLNSCELFYLEADKEVQAMNQERIASYLLFRKKNLSYIKLVLKRIPFLPLIEDQKGKSLFEQTMDRYFDALKSWTVRRTMCEWEQVVYYENLLSLLLFHSDLKQVKYRSKKGIQLQRLKTFLLHYERQKISPLIQDAVVASVSRVFEQLTSPKEIKLSTDELYIKYQISDRFSPTILKEVRKMDRPLDEDSALSSELILTIDGVGAHEIDDGISCQRLTNGNYFLGIHIADPLSVIPMFSPIIQEASNRGTSIYYDDQVIPMLPSDLSCHRLSLESNHMRYARSFYFQIKPDGTVEKDSFYTTHQVIQVYDNLTYNEANLILKTGHSADSKILESLTLMQEVASKIKGTMPYSTLDYYTIDSLLPSEFETGTSSQKMVEIMMLFLNHQVASYYHQSGYPFLYRNHLAFDTDIEKLERFKDTVKGGQWKKSIDLMTHSMERAFYSTENLGHSALGYDAYTHVSSPLRRYADLLVGYSIDVLSEKNTDDQQIYALEKVLKKQSRRLNSRVRLANEFSTLIDHEKTS